MDPTGRYYHLVAMRCDLVIEAPTTDPAAAVDWWLAHEAEEAAQMEIIIDNGKRVIKRAVVPRTPESQAAFAALSSSSKSPASTSA